MTLSLDILAARMRQGESIPLGDTARVAVALSVPAILQQLVVTAMEYIDAAMVGHIGAEATAAIGIVSSSTWMLHGILVGLFTSFAIQIAQYLGADRQDDARGVLRQSMIFNILLGCGMAALGIGINEFLSGDDIAENDLPRRAEENILQTAADGKRPPSLRKRGSSASPFFPRKPGTPSAPLNAPPQPKGMTPQRPCGSGLPDNTIPKAILRKRSGLPS